jgi:hypothetical protein
MASVYSINKGINKPLVFKGLKAQYVWYLGGGLVLLLVVFAILYVCGVNNFVCLGLVLILGSFLVGYVYRLSSSYGQHGMMKKIAKRGIPTVIRSYSRREFIHLKR